MGMWTAVGCLSPAPLANAGAPAGVFRHPREQFHGEALRGTPALLVAGRSRRKVAVIRRAAERAVGGVNGWWHGCRVGVVQAGQPSRSRGKRHSASARPPKRTAVNKQSPASVFQKNGIAAT